MNLSDFRIWAAPEMTLLGLICVVLIADLFVDDDKRIVTFWLAMISVAITALTVLLTDAGQRRRDFRWQLHVSDALSQILKLGCALFVAIGFLYARDYLAANELHKGEFYLLGLFGLLGMLIMISANSMLTMYLGSGDTGAVDVRTGCD